MEIFFKSNGNSEIEKHNDQGENFAGEVQW